MRIDLLFPVLPPTLDGIGDHTARLSSALAAHADVRVLTAQADTETIPDVEVRRAFRLPPRRGVVEVIDAVRRDAPDWLFVQFNQFSYGRWGLNPFLPLALWRLKRIVSEPQIAVMFHEDFVPITSWKNAVMTTWQRAQFWVLGALADQVFFSIEPWVRQYQSWWPGKPVYHLPVGSNIPFVKTERSEIRTELGIDDDTFVMGVFGSLHASRLVGHIRAAAEAVLRQTDDALLLYIGPHGDAFSAEMYGLPVLNAGRLPAEEVSRHFQAMDVHLAPFIDGASTRRGSFLTGLQHGVCSVSTSGPLTDEMLRDRQGDAFILPPVSDKPAFANSVVSCLMNQVRRQGIAVAGQRFYNRHLSFERAAERVMNALTTEREVV